MEARVSRKFQEFKVVFGRVETHIFAVCPNCLDNGRQIFAPHVVSTKHIGNCIEKYYRCKHPNCASLYKAVECSKMNITPDGNDA